MYSLVTFISIHVSTNLTIHHVWCTYLPSLTRKKKKILSKRIVTRLRALVILPTRDLVSQVRETFEMIAKGSGLKVSSCILFYLFVGCFWFLPVHSLVILHISNRPLFSFASSLVFLFLLSSDRGRYWIPIVHVRAGPPRRPRDGRLQG